MQIAKPQQPRDKNGSFSTTTTTTFTPKSVKNVIIPTSFKAMDLTSPKHFKPPSVFDSHHGHVGAVKEPPLEGKASLFGKSIGNPFADTFPDPLCKLNLKETSEFVKSFPVANNNSIESSCRGILDISVQRREGVSSVVQQRRPEAPSTPGRPLFSFSTHSRKSFPSKWDDAQKWLISSSCHDSPAHKLSKQCENSRQQQAEVFAFAEKSRVTEEKVTIRVGGVDHHGTTARSFNGVSDVPLKDKFTDHVDPILPNFRYSEPSKEGFLFRNSAPGETMKNASTEMVHEVHHRDVGTEMTPLGSSTTSRCHTPLMSSSPARHNTPANRSGPLAMANPDSTIEVCHLAKLQLGTQFDSVASNWSSKEEEEEEISKSLRHFETGNGFRRSVSDSRAAAWEEEEKTKCCLRYQREEAKIQAWVNLQNAKAEAQSRKLEVKIQKMRSDLEEKLMKRMAAVQRKAEEWRIAAQKEHSEQIHRAEEQVQKMKNSHNSQLSSHRSCGCFPCNIP